MYLILFSFTGSLYKKPFLSEPACGRAGKKRTTVTDEEMQRQIQIPLNLE